MRYIEKNGVDMQTDVSGKDETKEETKEEKVVKSTTSGKEKKEAVERLEWIWYMVGHASFTKDSDDLRDRLVTCLSQWITRDREWITRDREWITRDRAYLDSKSKQDVTDRARLRVLVLRVLCAPDLHTTSFFRWTLPYMCQYVMDTICFASPTTTDAIGNTNVFSDGTETLEKRVAHNRGAPILFCTDMSLVECAAYYAARYMSERLSRKTLSDGKHIPLISGTLWQALRYQCFSISIGDTDVFSNRGNPHPWDSDARSTNDACVKTPAHACYASDSYLQKLTETVTELSDYERFVDDLTIKTLHVHRESRPALLFACSDHLHGNVLRLTLQHCICVLHDLETHWFSVANEPIQGVREPPPDIITRPKRIPEESQPGGEKHIIPVTSLSENESAGSSSSASSSTSSSAALLASPVFVRSSVEMDETKFSESASLKRLDIILKFDVANAEPHAWVELEAAVLYADATVWGFKTEIAYATDRIYALWKRLRFILSFILTRSSGTLRPGDVGALRCQSKDASAFPESSTVLSESGAMFAESSAMLSEGRTTLTESSATLTESSAILTESSAILTESSVILTESSAILTESIDKREVDNVERNRTYGMPPHMIFTCIALLRLLAVVTKRIYHFTASFATNLKLDATQGGLWQKVVPFAHVNMPGSCFTTSYMVRHAAMDMLAACLERPHELYTPADVWPVLHRMFDSAIEKCDQKLPEQLHDRSEEADCRFVTSDEHPLPSLSSSRVKRADQHDIASIRMWFVARICNLIQTAAGSVYGRDANRKECKSLLENNTPGFTQLLIAAFTYVRHLQNGNCTDIAISSVHSPPSYGLTQSPEDGRLRDIHGSLLGAAGPFIFQFNRTHAPLDVEPAENVTSRLTHSVSSRTCDISSPFDVGDETPRSFSDAAAAFAALRPWPVLLSSETTVLTILSTLICDTIVNARLSFDDVATTTASFAVATISAASADETVHYENASLAGYKSTDEPRVFDPIGEAGFGDDDAADDDARKCRYRSAAAVATETSIVGNFRHAKLTGSDNDQNNDDANDGDGDENADGDSTKMKKQTASLEADDMKSAVIAETEDGGNVCLNTKQEERVYYRQCISILAEILDPVWRPCAKTMFESEPHRFDALQAILRKTSVHKDRQVRHLSSKSVALLCEFYQTENLETALQATKTALCAYTKIGLLTTRDVKHYVTTIVVVSRLGRKVSVETAGPVFAACLHHLLEYAEEVHRPLLDYVSLCDVHWEEHVAMAEWLHTTPSYCWPILRRWCRSSSEAKTDVQMRNDRFFVRRPLSELAWAASFSHQGLHLVDAVLATPCVFLNINEVSAVTHAAVIPTKISASHNESKPDGEADTSLFYKETALLYACRCAVYGGPTQDVAVRRLIRNGANPLAIAAAPAPPCDLLLQDVCADAIPADTPSETDHNMDVFYVEATTRMDSEKAMRRRVYEVVRTELAKLQMCQEAARTEVAMHRRRPAYTVQ
jgi:hypothetical protein